MASRDARKRFQLNRGLLLALSAAGLGCVFTLAGCQKIENGQSNEIRSTDPVLVRVLSIPESRTSETRSFPIFVKEGQTAKLSFRVPGQLQEFNPILGKKVTAGEIVAQLDQRDYKLAVARLEKGIDEANSLLSAMETGARTEDIATLKAQLHAAQTASTNADTQLKRMDNLLSDGTASQVQYDAAKTTADAAAAQAESLKQQLAKAESGSRTEEIDAMKAKIAGLKVDLELARNKLADTELKAPFNGIISRKYFDNYETIAPGIAILELINTDKLEASLNVPEEIVLRQNDIESIRCTFSTIPGISFPASVKEIGQIPNSGSLAYPFTVLIDQSGLASAVAEGNGLIPGMSGTAEITLTGNTSTILLPSAALIPNEGESDQTNESAVWVISSEMKLERHPVHIKTFTDEGVVVEDGLSGGEKVVGAGARFLTEGEEVRTEEL